MTTAVTQNGRGANVKEHKLMKDTKEAKIDVMCVGHQGKGEGYNRWVVFVE